MVNKIVGWLVLVPLCGLLIGFALANRHLVSGNLNPFATAPDASVAGYGIPLFVILYVVLLIGVLLGGVASWFAQGAHRRSERHWRREAKQLNDELEVLRRNTGAVSKPPFSDVDDMLDLR